MKIGVISDTHGYVDPQLAEVLAGVDAILHAGDVAGPEILHQLAAIAPVKAVRGNVDRGELGAGLEESLLLRLGSLRALLVHDLGTPARPHAPLAARIAREGVRLVVHGHSHLPAVELRGGVLFVNPGSAGPRRFRLPRSAGRMEVDGGRVRVELLDLEAGGAPLARPVEHELGADAT